MTTYASGPTVPGITQPAAYERNLPQVDRALHAGDNSETPEQASRAVALALYELAKSWFDTHAWYYRECVENLAMVNGAQYGYYSTWENRWIPVPEVRNSYEIRLVVNLEKPIVDQATAILTQEQPQFDCAPGATEVEDAAAAETANDLTRYIWDFHRLDGKFRTTAHGAFVCGTTFVRVLWDKTAGPFAPPQFTGGDPMGVDASGAVQFGDLAPQFTKQGDHLFETLQRDQVAYDPGAHAIDGTDGIGVMVREKLTRARLMELYPDTFKVESAAERLDSDGDQMREARVERYTPYDASWSVKSGTHDPRAEEVAIYTFYMRSREGYPFGRVFVFTADGQLLEQRDNDVYPTKAESDAGEQWPNYHWPVFALYCDTRENTPWGRGRVLDMHHAQKAVNGAFSKAVQYIAIIANTKVVMPKGLDVEWTDELGQVIRYGRTYQPGSIGYVTPQSTLLNDYGNVVAQGREFMENIAGVNAATQGAAPSADPSGRLAESLQARDYVRLEAIRDELYRKWALVIKYALRLFRRNATTPRRLLITGENGTTAMKFFEGAKLAAGTDVVVFNNQAVPRDPTKRMLWSMNFSTMLANAKDEQTKILLIRLMGKREFIPFLQNLNPHEAAAERMVRQLLLGQQPKARPWHHALTFDVVLTQFLSSEEFEAKAAQNPQMGAYAESLWQWYHQQAIPTPALPGAVPGAQASPAQGPATTSGPPESAMTPQAQAA